jgi:hypothetical protein
MPVSLSVSGVFVDGSSVVVQPTVQTLHVPLGNDATIGATIVNSANTAVNLTNCAVTLTVRDGVGGLLLFSRLGVVTIAAQGKVSFAISQADTASQQPGSYVYDVEVQFGDGSRAQVVPSSQFVVDSAVGTPSTQPTIQIPSMQGQSGNVLGTDGTVFRWQASVGLNPRGAWVSGGSYLPNDVLTNAGATYRCKASINPSNTAPGSDSAHFELWAAVGATGPQGAIGPQGSQGPAGGNLGGALNRRQVRAGDTPYTIGPTDFVLGVDTTTANITLNLPSNPAGGTAYVVNDDLHNSAAHPITIAAGAGDVIYADGERASYTINDGGSVLLVFGSDDRRWRVMFMRRGVPFNAYAFGSGAVPSGGTRWLSPDPNAALGVSRLRLGLLIPGPTLEQMLVFCATPPGAGHTVSAQIEASQDFGATWADFGPPVVLTDANNTSDLTVSLPTPFALWAVRLTASAGSVAADFGFLLLMRNPAEPG